MYLIILKSHKSPKKWTEIYNLYTCSIFDKLLLQMSDCIA